MPAERLELRLERLEVHNFRRGAVGLHVVHIDHGDEVVEFPVARGHRRLPGQTFVKLTVGEQGVDE